jgi:threonine dehydrogenase-like Zn-dependent dehydrogenase
MNSGFAGGAYGYVAMGPYQGGQADIFPTGWHGVVLSGFQPGESIAVFGAGPVGLMAAYSAKLRGASKVFVVDSVKERLEAAEKINCVCIYSLTLLFPSPCPFLHPTPVLSNLQN